MGRRGHLGPVEEELETSAADQRRRRVASQRAKNPESDMVLEMLNLRRLLVCKGTLKPEESRIESREECGCGLELPGLEN